MKKLNLLAKGAIALAIGVSSMFLANNLDISYTTVYASSQNEVDSNIQETKDSILAKKSILEDKIEFADKFMDTNAYKNASQSNKSAFDSEVEQIRDAFSKANNALAYEDTLDGLKKVDEEIDPALSGLLDTLNNIYREDASISKFMEAHMAIGINKIENVPKKYRSEYLAASEAIKDEYEKIWLENKVYNEKELENILNRYQTIVKKINKVNRDGDLINKMKKAIANNQEKVKTIEYLKEKMPESVKRYQENIDKALTNAKRAIDNALEWLEKNDK